MLREEILHKTSRTGTTVFYFVPNITSELAPTLQEPAYIMFDTFGNTIGYGTYSGKTYPEIIQLINNYNVNTPLASITNNFITGYSVTQTFNTVMSLNQRNIVTQRFTDNITREITGKTKNPITYQTYVLFREHEIDDMYANVKLTRTYETLDTLGVYNKPINSIPDQEARTGVLFGKLEAIQVIKDENGNNVRIPLKNVPIGIFNKSEDFPTPMSLDNNGDRFYMNLKSVSGPSDYFSPSYTYSGTTPIAYDEDQKFLKSDSQFLTLPDKFKFVTITNDNGEFVIYNAPLGNQVVVFEVDLFKQGLSKDEIALNNFPFPATENSNIGELPCYYYNQVPVDVVPAWGLSQSGYTELNIAVNLDLRKWATYIFAPGTYGNEKLETTTARNAANTLKIDIRDMTVSGFTIKPVEVVQVIDDLDRADGSQYFWYDEFHTQKSRLEYAKFGCHVLKLPANLYDPNGYKTNTNGDPTTSKGVWLAAYQFRVYVNKQRSYRDTGARKYAVAKMQSHFAISYAPSNANVFTDMSAIGAFPYERPWSINYPSKYSIPAKPKLLRFNYSTQKTYPSVLEEPAYSDGDLVGNVSDEAVNSDFVGGFGLQSDPNLPFGSSAVKFPNRIAFVATRDYMYKYERGVTWNETYANGYEPYWTGTGPGGTGIGPYGSYPALAGMSSVKNGEQYQRVECGYGYFMKYRDWNIIYRWPWVWDIWWNRNSAGPGTNSPGQSDGFATNILFHRYNTWNLNQENLALAFEQFEGNTTFVDGIDIYRIVNSGTQNISRPQQYTIPTFMRLNVDWYATRADEFIVYNRGDIPVKIKNSYNGAVSVVQAGFPNQTISPGQTFELQPNGYFNTKPNSTSIVDFTATLLPGNNTFDSNTNRYTYARYSVQVKTANGGWGQTFFNVPAYTENAAVNWYVNILHNGSSNGVVSAGITDNFDFNQDSSQDYPVPGGNANRNFYSPVITNFSTLSPYKGFFWDPNTMPNGGIWYG